MSEEKMFNVNAKSNYEILSRLKEKYDAGLISWDDIVAMIRGIKHE